MERLREGQRERKRETEKERERERERQRDREREPDRKTCELTDRAIIDVDRRKQLFR